MPSNSAIRAAKAKAVGGGRKRCSKGKACSATCISRVDVCLIDLSIGVSSTLTKASAFVQKIKGSKGPGTEQDNPSSSTQPLLNLKDAGEVKFYLKFANGALDRVDRVRKNPDIYPSVKTRVTKTALQDLAPIIKGQRASILENLKDASPENQAKVRDLLKRYDRLSAASKLDSVRSKVKEGVEGKLRDVGRATGKLRLGEKVEAVKNKVLGSPEGRFLKRLEKASDKYEYSFEGKGSGMSLSVIGETKSGNKVEFMLDRNGHTYFSVNDRYDSGYITDRKEQMSIALMARSMSQVVQRSLKPGSIIYATAYDGDGYGEGRFNAYKKAGFTAVDSGSYLVGGKVGKGGKLVPINEAESDSVKERYKSWGASDYAVFSEEVDYEEGGAEKVLEPRDSETWRLIIFGK